VEGIEENLLAYFVGKGEEGCLFSVWSRCFGGRNFSLLLLHSGKTMLKLVAFALVG